MRDIKFKAKRLDDGVWVYGDLTHVQKICSVEEKNKTGKSTMSVVRVAGYDVDEETIGQFTGLKDFNDNEIYDGDILKESMNDAKLLVRWSDNNGSFCLSEIVEDLQFYYDFPLGKEFLRRFSMEIVGNRWDMPELSNLKG